MTKSVTSFSAIAIILGVLLHAAPPGRHPPRPDLGLGRRQRRQSVHPRLAVRDVQQAYANTAAGGEIDVLDGGDFGPLNINMRSPSPTTGPARPAIPLAASASISTPARPIPSCCED